MDNTALAAAAAAVLAQLLAKGGAAFAEEFGKDAYEKSKRLLARLRDRLRKKPSARQTLDACRRSPGPESQTALAGAIEGELVEDPRWASRIAPLVQELALVVQNVGATAPKYHVEARVVGAVGDHARATIHLDKP